MKELILELIFFFNILFLTSTLKKQDSSKGALVCIFLLEARQKKSDGVVHKNIMEPITFMCSFNKTHEALEITGQLPQIQYLGYL